jgi:hypothetical protein
LRYSDSDVVEARLKAVAEALDSRLRALDRIATIPFNRMAEWGADGHILLDAPVYSPFVRHKERLDLG